MKTGSMKKKKKCRQVNKKCVNQRRDSYSYTGKYFVEGICKVLKYTYVSGKLIRRKSKLEWS